MISPEQRVAGHEAVVRTAREICPVAQKGNDESTCNLPTRRVQRHEKIAWMLRGMLQ